MLHSMRTVLLAAVLVAELGAGTITIALDKKLRPHPVWGIAELKSMPGMRDGLRAFSATLPFRNGARVRVVLIEREDSKPVWLIDKNLDGEVSPDEQMEVGAKPTVIQFPLDGEPFPFFPIQVKAVELSPKWHADMVRHNVRLLYHSHSVNVSGKADLDGTPYDFFYRVDSNTLNVPMSNAWMALDVDRDGIIDVEPWTDEMVHVLGKPVVFKIGDRYLRIDAVDVNAMTAIIQEVDASEYRLISMRVGRVLPDFSFVDFEGAPHSLKDELGPRYTVLYFWATWCAICQTEIRLFEQANRKYYDRGFRAVGINGDKNPAVARKFLKDRDVNFPQATWDSVKDLVEHRFRIEDWPTAILLDANLRVVSTNMKGEPHIRQEGLMATVEGLLSGVKPAAHLAPKTDDDGSHPSDAHR
jgi:thiol-disulfide isomerase/thioredoxin